MNVRFRTFLRTLRGRATRTNRKRLFFILEQTLDKEHVKRTQAFKNILKIKLLRNTFDEIFVRYL